MHSMTTVSFAMAGVHPGDDGTNEMVALLVELRRKYVDVTKNSWCGTCTADRMWSTGSLVWSVVHTAFTFGVRRINASKCALSNTVLE